ncbi:unnamed protein product, partial [Eruca vesicaria subsp. sativa]|nr:unnamed protein product [Eruca vesicaria subsp. sativa]
MAPKTHFSGNTNKEGAPEKKNESVEEKKKPTVEKKKAAAKKKDSALKKQGAKKIQTTKKKRKRDSGVDGGSSSNPIKRSRTATPPEHQADLNHSPTLSADSLSLDDREATPSPSLTIESQKSPTLIPSEADNSRQAPINSNNRESRSPEAAINNDVQRT